jgi:hypothetical protein
LLLSLIFMDARATVAQNIVDWTPALESAVAVGFKQCSGNANGFCFDGEDLRCVAAGESTEYCGDGGDAQWCAGLVGEIQVVRLERLEISAGF